MPRTKRPQSASTVAALVLLISLGALLVGLLSGGGGSRPPVPQPIAAPTMRPAHHFVAHTGSAAAPVVGEVLVVTSNGSWGNSPTSFTYNWQSCNAAGTTCATAGGSPTASSSYTVANADVGGFIRVQVTASNAGGSATQSSALATSAVPFSTMLAPNESFATSRTGPLFGYARQGGCNEINLVTDATFGPMLEFSTGDADHLLPGTNSGTFPDGAAYPTAGGCYQVHRTGGVATSLFSTATTVPAQSTVYTAFDMVIHSAQSGLSGGTFPTTGLSASKWFSVMEALGGVVSSPAVIVSLTNNTHVSGSPLELSFGYVGRDYSLWDPVPFTFDQVHHIIVHWVVSPCGTTNGGSYTSPPAPVTCTAGQSSGYSQVTDNGVAFKANFGAGADHANGPTQQTSAAQTVYLFVYRSTGSFYDTPADGSGPLSYGGTTKVLFSGERVGTTLASVQ